MLSSEFIFRVYLQCPVLGRPQRAPLTGDSVDSDDHDASDDSDESVTAAMTVIMESERATVMAAMTVMIV